MARQEVQQMVKGAFEEILWSARVDHRLNLKWYTNAKIQLLKQF